MSAAECGMAEKPSCLLLSAKTSHDLGTRDCPAVKETLKPKHVWSIRERSGQLVVDIYSQVIYSPSRLHARPHLSTRQYARLVYRWVDSIGLESVSYGTHSMRRTKATRIYRKTGNLRIPPPPCS